MNQEVEINDMITQLTDIVNQKTQSVNQSNRFTIPSFSYKLIDKKIKELIHKKRLDSDQLSHIIRLYGLFDITQFQIRFITRLINPRINRHEHDKIVMRIDKAVKKCFQSHIVTEAVPKIIVDTIDTDTEKVQVHEHFRQPTMNNNTLRHTRQNTYYFIR